jgi:hypothetical protein
MKDIIKRTRIASKTIAKLLRVIDSISEYNDRESIATQLQKECKTNAKRLQAEQLQSECKAIAIVSNTMGNDCEATTQIIRRNCNAIAKGDAIASDCKVSTKRLQSDCKVTKKRPGKDRKTIESKTIASKSIAKRLRSDLKATTTLANR